MENKKSPELVKKYEEMLARKVGIYFDADEFEEIAFYYELEEQYDLALEAIQNGLLIHPANNELQVKKALYLLCVERKSEALELIESLLVNTTQNLLIKADIYLANERKEEAIAIVEGILEVSEPEFTLFLDISDVFANNDLLDDSIEYLKKGLVAFPNQQELMRELAFTYGDSEQFESMVELLNRLLDINPYEIHDWISLIRAYGSLNQLDKAIEACDFALAIDESNEEVQMMRSVCLYENGNIEAAVQAFEKCIQFQSVTTAFLLVVIQSFLELKRYESALQVANRILELDPLQAEGHYQKSIAYIGLKDAISAYDSILAATLLEPGNGEYLVVKADLLTERGDLAEAKEILLQILEGEPEFYKAYFPLAFIYEQEAEWAKSLEYYGKSYAVNANDLVSLLKMVKMFYLTGDYESTVYHKILLDELLAVESPINILDNDYLLREYERTNEYVRIINDLQKDE